MIPLCRPTKRVKSMQRNTLVNLQERRIKQ